MHTCTRTTVGALTALGAGVLLALAAPAAANAHVGVDPSDTTSGSYTVLAFSVPHGCEASPTTKITITMPDGIDRVTPTVNPNWTVEKVMQPLDEPKDDGHGGTFDERVDSVVYTAVTPLPSDLRDVVELSLKLPDAAGETLAFPVLQECTEGSTDWSEPVVEGEAEPEYPAPTIVVTEASSDAHGDGDGHSHDADATEDDAADTAADTASAETVASTKSGGADDVIARVLGIGGLVVGAVGVVLAITARRGAKAE